MRLGALFRSLRVRLLALSLVVAVVSVLATAWVASRTAETQFRDYLEADDLAVNAILDDLFFYDLDNGGWEGVDDEVERLALEFDERIAVVRADGTVLADSDDLLDAGDEPLPRNPEAIVTGDPAIPDSDVSIYLGRTEVVGGREESVLGAINDRLVVAAVVVAVAAVGVTVLVSRRLLRRIGRLTAAARGVEEGDLDVRVGASGSDEVGELGRAFDSMADALDRNERIRRRMVSDVAHELRTPLANIRGYAEATRDGVLEPSPEVLASIHEEAVALGRLVDDLQDLARAEAGELRLDPQPVAVRDVIEPAVAGQAARAEGDGIRLRVDVPGDLPTVAVDIDRIGQVVRNLVENALRHTDAGGTVRVAAHPNGTEVAISVSDDGEGISAEHLPHVFDRFWRADASRSRSTGGSGLGLAIAREIVAAHGGDLRVTSEPGEGTSFTFTVPVAG